MRIHHVAFRTDDVEALERFYVDVLGLTVTRRQARSVWLDAGGAIVMIERRSPGEPRVDRASHELVCFAVSPAERERFSALVEIESRSDYTLYFRDPDGRRIGVSSYPDR